MMEKSFSKEQLERRYRQLEENLAVIRPQVGDAAQAFRTKPRRDHAAGCDENGASCIMNNKNTWELPTLGKIKSRSCAKNTTMDIARCHCQFIPQTNKVKQLTAKWK